MTQTQIYWLHTLSPTHIGTGRGAGYIDLPIHRDKVTHWPVIPASAFKGVWRDWAQEQKKEHIDLAFGRASDYEANASNSGALIPTDARIVCLPVRSFQGTFAWCTSPLALRMLHRDLSMAGVSDLPDIPAALDVGVIHRTETTKLEENGRIYLEDLDFTGQACKAANDWANKLAKWIFPDDENSNWRNCFVERFAVVADKIFDFLTETGTEVTTRVRIDDDLKTVKQGQLWNEEALPAETILTGLIACDRLYTQQSNGLTPQTLLEKFTASPLTLQIGGKATIGRGKVRCVFTAHTGGDQ